MNINFYKSFSKSIAFIYVVGLIFLIIITSSFSLRSKKEYFKSPEFDSFFQDSLSNRDSTGCVVYVSFIVDKKGKVSRVRVDSCDCDSDKVYVKAIKEEAIRVIKDSPTWEPYIHNGKPVSVKYSLPVRFSNEPDTLNGISE
jgi:hypothetical protein